MKFIQSKYFGFVVLFFFIFFLAWSFGPMKTIEKKLVNATGSKEMLDIEPASSPEHIYEYVNKLGEPGIKVLTEMYTFQDLVYPIAYGFFFVFAILFFISRSFPGKSKMLWLSLAAFLMMIADYLENFSILTIISNPAEQLGIAVFVGSFTTIKWLLGLMAGILFLVFFLIYVYKKWIRRKV